MKRSIFLALMLAACTTTEESKPIDSEIDIKGETPDGAVGIDKEGESIIQKKTQADDELTLQQDINLRLQRNLGEQASELQRCREDLADPRLGGHGRLEEDSEAKVTTSVAAIREQIGLDAKGDLVVVKRQDFKERLKLERQLEAKLKGLVTSISSERDTCMRKMGHVRVKHGLPAARYQAKGYFAGDGTWIETRKGETSLDDAFKYAVPNQRQTPRNNDNDTQL